MCQGTLNTEEVNRGDLDAWPSIDKRIHERVRDMEAAVLTCGETHRGGAGSDTRSSEQMLSPSSKSCQGAVSFGSLVFIDN